MSKKHRRPRQIGKPESKPFVQAPKRDDLIAYLFRCQKRELIRRGMIEDPATRPSRYKFHWVYGNLNGTVYADNKSDARALIKKDLGIKKKNRLPIEVEITREVNIEANDDDSEESPGEGEDCNNQRAKACQPV